MKLTRFERFLLLIFVFVWPPSARSQSGPGAGGAGAAGGPGYRAVEPLLEGQTIAGVAVVVQPDDPQLRARILDVLPISPGDAWEPVLGDLTRAAIRALPGVEDVRLEGRDLGGFRRQLVIRVRTEQVEPTPSRRGLLQSGRISDFPALYREGGVFFKVELSGGFGVYSDANPWFGRPEVFTLRNPLVEDPSVGAGTGAFANWGEAFVQFGLSGVTPLVQDRIYVYGAVTGIGIATVGRDIFRSDTRGSINLEQGYGGLLWAPEGSSFRFKISVGRQNFTLNDGFLVSQFGSQWNAGLRPGVYMSPRTTHDFSILSTVRFEKWSGQVFFLNPNEYEPIESNTQLLGTNLRRQLSDRVSIDATVMTVPRSDTTYRVPEGASRGREGLLTFALHAHLRAPPQVSGLWLSGSVAHQRHADFAMSAWAGYVESGFIARSTPLTPSLSYRLAHFTGDDPRTRRFERFDTLYSGGLDHWLQGITINKLLSQANRTTHRIRLNVAPVRTLNLTLDLYLHLAHQLNNLGGNPALGTLDSHDLGQEAQLTARWAVSRKVLVQGIASAAFPGAAVEGATPGPDDPWTTLQLQVFWGF